MKYLVVALGLCLLSVPAVAKKSTATRAPRVKARKAPTVTKAHKAPRVKQHPRNTAN